jgi:catechol 2,3-dioxygenase
VTGGTNAPEHAIGLDHVAFNIGKSLDELRDAKAKLEAAGIKPTPIDHEVTKSLYFNDPDGNGVELYVDVSDAWRTDPQRVAQLKPLVL